MAADEGQAHQTNGIIIFQWILTVLKSSLQWIIVISWSIRYDWTYLAYRVCLPCSKSFGKFFAAYPNIIIDRKIYLGFAFFGNLIAPVHWVVWGLIKVDLAFPAWCSLIDSHLFGGFLIVPDNVHFCDDRAVHGGIPLQKSFKLCIISIPSICDCYQPKTKSSNSNV